MRSVTRRRADRSNTIIHGEFDIHMDGNTFVKGVTRTPDGVVKEHNSLESLYETLVSIPDITWFTMSEHRFNFTYLVPHLMNWIQNEGHSVRPIPSGEDIIGLVLKRKTKSVTYKPGKRKAQVIDKISVHTEKIVIRDAIHLFQTGLDDAVTAFAPEVSNVGKSDNPQYSTLALHAAYEGLDRTLTDHFKVHPGWTAGGTAVKAWMSTIPKGFAYYRVNPRKEKFVREAYYGGFTYPGRSTMIYLDVWSIDRRAAFAATMRLGVPYGQATWTEWFVPDKPGFYEVFAESPGTSWPLIPYRSETGLHWINQSCITHLSDLEIRWYTQRGWHFYVLDGLFFRGLEFPFNKFIDRCEQLEYPNGKPANLALKYAVKPMRTGLYGRLGMNTEQEQLTIIRDPPNDEGYRHLIDKHTGEVIQDVWLHTENIDATYINPHWSAYITANQRLHLFDVMEMIGIDNVYYADTDCVKSDRESIKQALEKLPSGNGYGTWRVDGVYEWMKVNAPKDYYGMYNKQWAEEHDLDERRFGKAKSIPSDILRQHPEYQETHEQFEINTRTSFTQTLLHQDKPITLVQKRSSSSLAGSPSWQENSDHSITPRKLRTKTVSIEEAIPAIPTAKDGIRWLNDLGHSYRDIANMLDVPIGTINSIMSGRGSGRSILDRLQLLIEDVVTSEGRKKCVA